MRDDSRDQAWKPIPSWEGWYEASDTGLIRSVTRTIIASDGHARTYRSKILSPGFGEYGHMNVFLYRQQEKQQCRVHQLVMLTFVGPAPDGMVVCHNDGDATNNHLWNLRYDTPSENTLDNVRNGTHVYSRRRACKWDHLLVGPNLRITKRQRVCLSCHNARNVMSKARLAGRPVPEFHALVAEYYAATMASYVDPVPAPRSETPVVEDACATAPSRVSGINS